MYQDSEKKFYLLGLRITIVLNSNFRQKCTKILNLSECIKNGSCPCNNTGKRNTIF